jgi:hypothetical protein
MVPSSDAQLMPLSHKTVIHASELLRHCADRIPIVTKIADSVYVESRKDHYSDQ